MTDEGISTNLFFDELEGLIRKGHRVVLPVKGKSMLPFLKEGRDKVLLGQADKMQVDDIVLARLSNGAYVMHRIFALDDERLILMGDGNVYGKESCSQTDVLAKVISIQRKDETIVCNNRKMLRRVRIWKSLLPVRRYLLFIYRHIF